MLTYEEIIQICQTYKIENGTVINKINNLPLTDENEILRVKSAILLFREANAAYQSDVQQFGHTSKSQATYLTDTMSKFSVHNEESTYGINKLIRAILASNGHYEEYVSGKDLTSSKFSLLVPPKSAYGLAYLKMKFREKGLDIDNLTIKQDLSELAHNGVSKVIIDFKIKKYVQKAENTKSNTSSEAYTHPQAEELNKLERQKQIAKASNDRAAYIAAQKAIAKIIAASPAQVSPQQWDTMNIPQRISFIKMKMQEAKVLQDEDSFNYWRANLTRLENLSLSSSPTPSPTLPSAEKATLNEQPSNTTVKEDYLYYFNEIIRLLKMRQQSRNLTPEQIQQFVGEIHYNEMQMINLVASDKEILHLMTLVVDNLKADDFEQGLSNTIFKDLQDKYQTLHPTPKADLSSSTEDLSPMIATIRQKLTKIVAEYHTMLSDGKIDDEELARLINLLEQLLDEALSLKSIATNPQDLKKISTIIDEVNNRKNKMRQVLFGAEDIVKNFN